jgi:predicted ArsR family transcriptional regulator
MMENIRDEWKPREVLLGIHRCGGEGTTPEITEMTDLDGQQIRYQLRRNLEPAGYVVTEQPESEGGVTPPKRMRLTDQGETMAEQIVENRDGEHTIESTLSAVGDEIEELTARVGALENQVSDEGLKAEMNTLRDDLDAVSSAVGEIQGAKYGALSDEAVEEIAGLKATKRTFIEFVEEVLGKDDEMLPLAKENKQDVLNEMGLSDKSE